MFKFLQRKKKPEPEPVEEEEDELDSFLDVLESNSKQLDALQLRLAGVEKASRERSQKSQEASEELKKTMSVRMTPELLKRLSAKVEDDERTDGPAFGTRDKLPSGAG